MTVGMLDVDLCSRASVQRFTTLGCDVLGLGGVHLEPDVVPVQAEDDVLTARQLAMRESADGAVEGVVPVLEDGREDVSSSSTDAVPADR